jgi:hypothetical protein
LAGENIGSRFVVPTVAGCVDIVVHLDTEHDGTHRMTARSMLPDHPPPRVRHGWRCLAAGPYHDEDRELANGRVLTVTVCASCGGSDVLKRVRAESVERSGAT